MCKCDPHRRGYCDDCSREMASDRESRHDNAAKEACRFIYAQCPDTPDRERILLLLNDSAAIDRKLKNGIKRQAPQ